ncbi:hypothetical protein LXL04_032772 [Taraxacum kok-saghyz]
MRAVCKCSDSDHGPRTESDIKLSYQTPRTTDRVRHHRQILGLRFLYTDRVRGKTSDRVCGLTSQRRYQTLGPRTESVVCSPSPSLNFSKQPVIVTRLVTDSKLCLKQTKFRQKFRSTIVMICALSVQEAVEARFLFRTEITEEYEKFVAYGKQKMEAKIDRREE